MKSATHASTVTPRKSRKMLILSCSKLKASYDRPRPAIEVYKGVFFQVIKKMMREKNFPNCVDVAIISARYGFLWPDSAIEHYDLKMDSVISRKLRLELSRTLHEIIVEREYDEIFVNLGKQYREAIDEDYQQTNTECKWVNAFGGTGQRQRQMKDWLLKVGGGG
jgi:cytoplasmic iron level regulating protein YaaA (DUF328/UPF0246 family)